MSIDRIRDEMAGAAEDGMIQTVGELISLYISQHPDKAQAFYAEGKSIKGAIGSMSEIALKRKGPQSYGYLTLRDGAMCALKYYGVQVTCGEMDQLERAFYAGRGQAAPEPEPAVDSSLDLDALLGAEV